MNNNICKIKYYVYIYITIEREKARCHVNVNGLSATKQTICDKIPQSLHSKSSTSEQKKLATLAVTYPPDSTNLWQNHRSFMEEFL